MSRTDSSKNRSSRRRTLMSHSAHHAEGVISLLHTEGKINTAEAIKRLEHGNSDAQLRAGEMALEQAYNDDSVLTVATWLGRAKDNLESVVRCEQLSSNHANATAGRALIHLAQLPNHAAIVGSDKLPALNVSGRAYSQTVSISNSLADDFHEIRQSDTSDHPKALAGLLGEAAVLLLGQRYALRSMADESWLPMLSLFSADNANTHGTHINKAWDMSVLTDVGDGINIGNKVQVKTSLETLHKSSRPENVDGITTVCLRPDLMLDSRENFSVTTIIRECFNEQRFDRPSISDRLDRRTEQLLDILG